ncbi:MAG: hypothetical protein WCC41_06640, partial [Rhodomicrobium sp.]
VRALRSGFLSRERPEHRVRALPDRHRLRRAHRPDFEGHAGLGYMAAVSFYQIATYARDPATSRNWLIGCAVAFSLAVISLWVAGRAQGRRLAALPAE